MDSAFGKVADVAFRHGTGGVYSKATVHLGIDPLAEKELLWIAQVQMQWIQLYTYIYIHTYRRRSIYIESPADVVRIRMLRRRLIVPTFRLPFYMCVCISLSLSLSTNSVWLTWLLPIYSRVVCV